MLFVAIILLPTFVILRYARQATDPTDAELNAAVARLFEEVDPDRRPTTHIPVYAQQQIRWVVGRYRANTLPLLLVDASQVSDADKDALMTSSGTEKAGAILVLKPAFTELLREGPAGVAGPFTAEQRNDFVVGVVHAAVHLRVATMNQNAATGVGDDAAAQERRVWRDVMLNVVRPMRSTGAPLHHTFVQVDDAFQRCNDRIDCLLPPVFVD